jgi:hypothetical protein
MATEGDLKVTKGSLKTYTYKGDSGNLALRLPSSLPPNPPKLNPSPTGKDVNCYYCPNCTSHVYHHQTVLGNKIIIRTGLLQGSKDFGVHAEIFGKDRLKWQPEVAKTFQGPPE